jgi:hypothetical protein
LKSSRLFFLFFFFVGLFFWRFKNTDTQTPARTHTEAFRHTRQTQAQTHTYINTYANAHTARTQSHTTQMHTDTDQRTRAYRHTYLGAYVPWLCSWFYTLKVVRGGTKSTLFVCREWKLWTRLKKLAMWSSDTRMC